MSTVEALRLQCKALRLPTMATIIEETLQLAQQESWSLELTLHNLLEQEVLGRERRRIERLLKRSGLPAGKRLDLFDLNRLPLKAQRQIQQLATGDFVDRAGNALFFGLPGTGKTHAACGVAYQLVQTGRSVLFLPTYQLVARLLRAKREYELDMELRRLDKFQVVILDDIGYVQQTREEMEVLFTFLAERYERRSVMITSNLVFSEWNQIFKNPLTTAAAIDRVVHHSVIVEFGPHVSSRRAEEAAQRNQIPLKGSTPEKNVG